MTELQFQPDCVDTLSERVIQAVAAETDTDPLDLNPLYLVINPDCLDSLFETTGGGLARNNGTASFRYHGCDVTVSSGGDIEVISLAVETTAEAQVQPQTGD